MWIQNDAKWTNLSRVYNIDSAALSERFVFSRAEGMLTLFFYVWTYGKWRLTRTVKNQNSRGPAV